MSPAFLADLIVAVHVAWVAVVVLGQLAILVGVVRGWGWVRNLWFRVIHLAMILIVAGESMLNVQCPLTVWEKQLRQSAGQAVTGDTFIGSCLHNLIFFYNVPDWVFDTIYISFALLVAATFVLAPPRWRSLSLVPVAPTTDH